MGCSSSVARRPIPVPTRIPGRPEEFLFFSRENTLQCLECLRALADAAAVAVPAATGTPTFAAGSADSLVRDDDGGGGGGGGGPNVNASSSGSSVPAERKDATAAKNNADQGDMRSPVSVASADSSVADEATLATPYYFDDGGGATGTVNRFFVEDVPAEIAAVRDLLAQDFLTAPAAAADLSASDRSGTLRAAGYAVDGIVPGPNTLALSSVPTIVRAQALILAHRGQLVNAKLQLKRPLDQAYVAHHLPLSLPHEALCAIAAAYQEANASGNGNLTAAELAQWMCSQRPEWAAKGLVAPGSHIADSMVFLCMTFMAPRANTSGLSAEEFVIFIHHFLTATSLQLRSYMFDCLHRLVPAESQNPENLAAEIQTELRDRFDYVLRSSSNASNTALLRALTSLTPSRTLLQQPISHTLFIDTLQRTPEILADVDVAQAFLQGAIVDHQFWHSRRRRIPTDFRRIATWKPLDARGFLTPKRALSRRINDLRNEGDMSPQEAGGVEPRQLHLDLQEARSSGSSVVRERRRRRRSFRRGSSSGGDEGSTTSSGRFDRSASADDMSPAAVISGSPLVRSQSNVARPSFLRHESIPAEDAGADADSVQ